MLLYFICETSLEAQTLKYTAYLNDQKIGEMTAVKEVNDEAERIKVTGHYEFMGDSLIKFAFDSKSAYMDGILTQVEASTQFDGGDKFKIKFFVSGKSIWVDKDIIVWSWVIKLYIKKK